MILCNTQMMKISLDSSFLLILRKHLILYHGYLYKNHSIFFNFGTSIQKWVRLFLTNCSSAVNQCGHMSETFTLYRGCRQGDPLSPYLFLICAEILAILIRRNSDIKGINLVDKEKKLLC